jgi:hypothetical protein
MTGILLQLSLLHDYDFRTVLGAGQARNANGVKNGLIAAVSKCV